MITGGVDFLRVQAGGVVEEAGERGVHVLLLVGLGGAAQRTQVLEHPLGIGAPLMIRRVVAQLLVVPDEAAGQGHRGDHHVPERPSGLELGPHLRQPKPELHEPSPRRLARRAVQIVRACRGGDQNAAVPVARPRDQSRYGRGADAAAG